MKRREGESYEDYRNRRKADRVITDGKLKGRVVWPSVHLEMSKGEIVRKRDNGTFRRKKLV